MKSYITVNWTHPGPHVPSKTTLDQTEQLLDVRPDMRLHNLDFGSFNVEEDEAIHHRIRAMQRENGENVRIDLAQDVIQLRGSVLAIGMLDCLQLNPSLLLSNIRKGTRALRIAS